MNKGTHAELKAERKLQAMTKTDKQLLKREFLKAWNEKMAEYCTNATAEYAILPNGGIVTIDKQSIKTRFCFGESGYDFEDAVKNAQTARTSAEYFKAENMENFERWLKELREASANESNYMLFIRDTEYYGQQPDCLLRGIQFERIPDIIDAFGGSCFLSEVAGKDIIIGTNAGHIATPIEYDVIISAFERAAAAHEKKIAAYLKRYGLSNVLAWTYWRDA